MNRNLSRTCLSGTVHRAWIFVLLFLALATPVFADGSKGIVDGFKGAVGDIFVVIEIVLGLAILSMFIYGSVRAVRKGEVSEGVTIIIFGILVIVAFYLVASEFNLNSTSPAGK